jgi:Acyl-CoA synthetases (AMP-forming)/AMP-acid ligases II
MLGTLANGMTVTTVNPAYTAHEIRQQIDSSTPRALITNANLLDTVRKACDTSSVDVVVCLDDVTVNDSGVVNMSDVLEHGDDKFSADLSAIDPMNDTAFILYSSGTTGLPKGVMIKHHSMTSNILQIRDFFGENMPKDILAVLPMYHIYGLNFILLTNMYHGNTIHSLPAFDPVTFLSCIQNNKVC